MVTAHPIGTRLIAFCLALSLFAGLSPVCTAIASNITSTWIQTTQADFEAGVSHLADTSTSPGDVTLMQNPGHVYALRGDCSEDFWKYDVIAGSWTSLADAPGEVADGGSLAYDSSYIYALRGDNRQDFWKYDIATDSWTPLADTPGDIRDGGALIHEGDYIYVLRGDNSQDFWKYNIGSDSWTALADTPSKVKGGGSLIVCDGSHIYALRGKNSQEFWKYDIGSDSWTTLADTPDDVDGGGALTCDGTYVYALRGKNSQDFWRYDINSNSWISLADTPEDVDDGGALTYNVSHIYALGGDASHHFWEYDISSNSWISLASTPEEVADGSALASVPQPGYAASGAIVSEVHDTGRLGAAWDSVEWSQTLQAATNITFEVRAADTAFAKTDASPPWVVIGTASPVTSGLPSGRYQQWKASLSTSDPSETPFLHDVTVTYSYAVAEITVSDIIDNPEVNVRATHTIVFTTSATGTLDQGDTITVTLPAGFTVPHDQTTGVAVEVDAVRIPGHSTANAIAGTVTFTLGSGADIAGATEVLMLVGSASRPTNPDTPGSYVICLATAHNGSALIDGGCCMVDIIGDTGGTTDITAEVTGGIKVVVPQALDMGTLNVGESTSLNKDQSIIITRNSRDDTWYLKVKDMKETWTGYMTAGDEILSSPLQVKGGDVTQYTDVTQELVLEDAGQAGVGSIEIDDLNVQQFADWFDSASSNYSITLVFTVGYNV